ncbi:MAG: DUF2851 family protein [Bacteroidales bacterium]|nr:DUF2851 family protein [Bacteroidales bacterium]
MQEALLQYIWKHSFFENKEYLADTNEKVIVLDPGTQNHDSGPDFINAKMRIDGTLWAGNVEIHLKSSDWKAHKHNTNPAYDNVILHIAQNIDTGCFNTINRRIPCISLIPDNKITERYYQLMEEEELIRCFKSIKRLDKSLLSFWLSSLAIERLQNKTDTIKNVLKFAKNNWEEAFYITIARSLGLKVNASPFEMLAKTVPLKILTKLRNNTFQIEALLFGQAGFLTISCRDEYFLNLKKEYTYLKRKFQLKEIKMHLWKFLRLRPSNFPTLRIAEFSSLLSRSDNLFSKTLACENPEQIRALYRSKASTYWDTHYMFGNESEFSIKSMGDKTIDTMIINTIVPFMFVYAEVKNNERYKTKALRFLEQIKPENNKIIKIWNKLDVKCRHAADSQALLQLTNFYCKKKRCLECQIGHLVLKKNNT